MEENEQEDLSCVCMLWPFLSLIVRYHLLLFLPAVMVVMGKSRETIQESEKEWKIKQK